VASTIESVSRMIRTEDSLDGARPGLARLVSTSVTIPIITEHDKDDIFVLRHDIFVLRHEN